MKRSYESDSMEEIYSRKIKTDGARGGVVVKALRYKSIPDGVIGIFQ